MITVGICNSSFEKCKQLGTELGTVLSFLDVSFSVQFFCSLQELSVWVETEEKHLDILLFETSQIYEYTISFLKRLKEILPVCQIIFLTPDHTIIPEIYEVDHVWLIPDGEISAYLKRAVSKSLSILSEQRTSIPGLLIREMGKTVLVPLSEILYISKVGRKSFIKCMNQDHFDSRSPAMLIPAMFSDRFLRCHQGYWVNFNKIRELDHEEFVLEDESRVPIGRVFRVKARQRFLEQCSDTVLMLNRHE